MSFFAMPFHSTGVHGPEKRDEVYSPSAGSMRSGFIPVFGTRVKASYGLPGQGHSKKRHTHARGSQRSTYSAFSNGLNRGFKELKCYKGVIYEALYENLAGFGFTCASKSL
jgi:hypothetical protein